MSNILLKCEEVTKRFGGLLALDSVSFSIKENEIIGLIGPNGAGKTTLINCLAGVYKLTIGKVYFNGKEITNFKPHQCCKMGIARTFQIPRTFRRLSPVENVMVGVLAGRSGITKINEARMDAEKWLDVVGLLHRKDINTENFTLQERKLLDLARALATRPKLLLIDEVLAGLNPSETPKIIETIRRLQGELNMTIIWVEHIVKAIMENCDRIIVLNFGKKLAEGQPKEIAKDEKVIEAYLGESVYE
jgi:branched-chain amino acid transport system ATP-binding protein